MSVRFVACVTRYSRGAVNRCGGKYNTGFIAIFLRCIITKNYPNWPRIDKVIAEIKRVQFFETVYNHTAYDSCMLSNYHVTYFNIHKNANHFAPPQTCHSQLATVRTASRRRSCILGTSQPAEMPVCHVQ